MGRRWRCIPGSDVAGFLERLSRRPDARLEIAGRLAAVLRIADGLDHSRNQDTRIRGIVDDGKAVTIYLWPSPHAQENAQFAMGKADLFNRLSARPIARIVATDGPLPEGERIKRRQEIAQAGRIIIKRQYEQLVSRQYGLGYLQDPEYVHEMRVAIRRMLAAIKTLGDDLDGQSRSIGKTLGDLGQFLGDVRDTDAFLEYLAQAAGECRPPGGGR